MTTDKLNEKQQSAINITSGPLLILAGAGTGKTKTVIARIKNILLNDLATEREILALTFTNKAAKEMKQRLQDFRNVTEMWIGTFHSVCSRLLRMYHKHANLESNFVIIDQTESEQIIKAILQEMNKEELESGMVKIIKSTISSFKEKSISPESAANEVFKIKGNIDVIPIYRKYQEKLHMYNLVDFDDLIFLTNQMMENNTEVRQKIQIQFKYIFVDEYQDTSHAQNKFVQMLADLHNNICCVGDEDQSIYSWRGADIKNILSFKKFYPDAEIVRLERNYRSSSNIIKTAMAVISNNKDRYKKELFTEDNSSNKVKIIVSPDCKREAAKIVKEAKTLEENGTKLNDMAILVRSAFQNRTLEEVFNEHRMPYRIIDGIKFYDRREVKDLIAYLRLACSPMDGSAFERIINVPKRGIGTKTVAEIQEYSYQNSTPIVDALEKMMSEGRFSPKLNESVKTFYNNVKQWQKDINENNFTLSNLANKIANESGYLDMLKEEGEKNDEEKNRIENISDLIFSLDGFSSLQEFLEHVALVNTRSMEMSEDAINILTIHAAKGLEFDAVFCPGWEENIFPSTKSIEMGSAQVEEERRLAYVAITRARKFLFLLYANSRLTFGRWGNNPVSRFLTEIKNNCSEDVIELVYEDQKPEGDSAEKQMHTRRGVSFVEKKSFRSYSNNNDQAPLSNTNHFKENDSVEHKTFGKGTVVKTMGSYVQVRIDGEEGIRLIHKNFLTRS